MAPFQDDSARLCAFSGLTLRHDGRVNVWAGPAPTALSGAARAPVKFHVLCVSVAVGGLAAGATPTDAVHVPRRDEVHRQEPAGGHIDEF